MDQRPSFLQAYIPKKCNNSQVMELYSPTTTTKEITRSHNLPHFPSLAANSHYVYPGSYHKTWSKNSSNASDLISARSCSGATSMLIVLKFLR